MAEIRVTEDGPYACEGVELVAAGGGVLAGGERFFLCRCGGSANKPFCDGTHARIGFDGNETADRGPVAGRARDYEGDGVTIHDDRSLCAHLGFCTDELPAVFASRRDPWIDAGAAGATAIARQVGRCPSGALAATLREAGPVEDELPARILPSPDGPYFVTGAVRVVAADGTPYEARNRQALCRCGGSANKPFCNGTHWSIGFTAP